MCVCMDCDNILKIFQGIWRDHKNMYDVMRSRKFEKSGKQCHPMLSLDGVDWSEMIMINWIESP